MKQKISPLENLFYLSFRVFFQGVKNLKSKSIGFWFLIFALMNLFYSLEKSSWHERIFLFFYPQMATDVLFKWYAGLSLQMDFLFLAGISFFLFVFFSGIIKTIVIQRYQRSLDLILLGHSKNPPKVLCVVKKGLDKTKLVIRCHCLGLSKFQKAQDDLSAAFSQNIESIIQGKSPGIVEMVLSKTPLKKVYPYSELKKKTNLQESFIVGQSGAGVIEQKIQELPHLLIAGTTGGGKSIFLKQVLLRLLETSYRLQMYLIDLKGGVELKSFSKLPNCQLAFDIDDAVNTLKAIQEEMKERFDYLKREDQKEIDPKRDKKDRIVIAIDEASILYTMPSRASRNYKKTMEARFLTDEIAKLGRAAAIHLIFATQKVTQRTIDTSIQENITGKMCFRMNTLQGSSVVLGNKAASVLPDIAGRAIWQMGQKNTEVQAPFLKEEELEESLDFLAEKFSCQTEKFQMLCQDHRNNEGNMPSEVEDGLKV